MKEYAFPSGHELRPLIAGDWTWPIHAGLSAILIFSVVMIVWHCRRPAWRCLKSPALQNGIAVLVVASIIVILLLPAVQQAKEAARRTQCKNQMKGIGLAIQSYLDVYGQYPFAGKVISDYEQVCSWRVALMPYMIAVPWHKFYHFNEPWDSPFNRHLIDEAWNPYSDGLWHPYKCPSHASEHRFTSYAMLTGPGTIGGDGLTATTINDITDGTSNTILVVEACGREIIWTEPKDVEVTDDSLGINLLGDQPGRSRGIISSHHIGGAHVLLADGTVRFLSEKIDLAVLKALTTIAGGETMPEF